MSSMTHRERVMTALNHEEPDRVPCDLGQGLASGINTKAYARLVEHLGLGDEGRAAEIDDRNQIAMPSEAVLQRFDVDVRGVYIGRPVTELTQNSYRDEWGVFWTRPESGGHFIFQEGPFQKKEPTLAELEKYPWPEPRLPHRIEGLKERAKQLHEETDYAVFLRLPYGIVWDCQRVRGFGQWLEDLVVNPVLAEALMDYSAMVNVGITEYALEEVGEYVDIVGFPDDLGFQDRPFMRPEVYRKMVKPYHGRVVDAIKRNTDAKVLMHNDGAIYPMIQDYIDIGVEVLNPVQVSAANMDSRRLKEEFGKDLSFWGAIDTGEVLPLGTPEDVRAEVKTRIDDLGPSGGYVLASVHNIQAEITAENIVAMFDSGKEYGRY